MTRQEIKILRKLKRKIRKGTNWLDAIQEHVDELKSKGKIY